MSINSASNVVGIVLDVATSLIRACLHRSIDFMRGQSHEPGVEMDASQLTKSAFASLRVAGLKNFVRNIEFSCQYALFAWSSTSLPSVYQCISVSLASYSHLNAMNYHVLPSYRHKYHRLPSYCHQIAIFCRQFHMLPSYCRTIPNCHHKNAIYCHIMTLTSLQYITIKMTPFRH